MRGMTLGMTAMLLLAVGHELNAQSVTPYRALRQGGWKCTSGGNCAGIATKSGWIASAALGPS
jgi:hypothetical protein